MSNNQPQASSYAQLLINTPFSRIHRRAGVNNRSEIVNPSSSSNLYMRWPWEYQTTLVFFWLDSVDLAIERVRTRVLEGGHNIPEPVIIRRYYSGLSNLSELREVSGTTESSGTSTIVSLPLGWTSSNTRILSCEIRNKSAGYWNGLGAATGVEEFTYHLFPDEIKIYYVDDPDLHSTQYRLLLMKVD